MSSGCARQHHPLGTTKSRAGGLLAHFVVQPADTSIRCLFFEQNFCKPCGQFSVCKSRIHVLAANRRHKVGSITTQKNQPFAEAACQKAMHTKNAFPILVNTSDINAHATQEFCSEITGCVFLDEARGA